MIGYTQDLEGTIGLAGLPEDQLIELTSSLGNELSDLQIARENGENEILALADKTDDLEEIVEIAARICVSAETVVILGTGGSSLGGQTLVRLADHGFGPRPGRPRVIFFDNVDPVTFAAFFSSADPSNIHFIAISKSGSTAETVLQTQTCISWLKAYSGIAPKDVFTIITEAKPSLLSKIADVHGIPRISHSAAIGGRYSALSTVGLLPAAIAGLEVASIRKAAAASMDASLKSIPRESPAALGAAVNVGLSQVKNIKTSVLMPYVDALQPFTFWYRQLWAESLGKDANGTLPVNALGTVDQHSQLQLYLGGPNDKFFSLVFAEKNNSTEIPSLSNEIDLGYLDRKSFGDLLGASQRATAETLIRHGRPTRIFHIQQPNEEAVGALMAHYMLETMLTARLLGVNPFDQPAVEESKALARNYLADTRQ
jgi:glucose-6-phosphate isomerase